MARRKATHEDTGFDWLDAGLKAFPELDEGFNIDLPGLDFDFAELDELLKLDDLPDFPFDLAAPWGNNHKCAPPKVSPKAAKTVPKR